MGCENSKQQKKLQEINYSDKKNDQSHEDNFSNHLQSLKKSAIKSFSDLENCSNPDQITFIDLKPTLSYQGNQMTQYLLNFTHLNSLSLDFCNYTLDQKEFKNLFEALKNFANIQKLQLNLWMSKLNDSLMSDLALAIQSQQNLILLSINLIENEQIKQEGMESLYEGIAYCKSLTILKLVTPVSANTKKSLNDLGNLILYHLIKLKELCLTIKCCEGIQNLIKFLSKTKSITFIYLNLWNLSNIREFGTYKYQICKSRRLSNIKILI
ncbi:hypothetical protein ABPG72_009387 [Tetrahymena utriculariae]